MPVKVLDPLGMVGGSPQETAIQNNIEGLISIVNAVKKKLQSYVGKSV